MQNLTQLTTVATLDKKNELNDGSSGCSSRKRVRSEPKLPLPKKAKVEKVAKWINSTDELDIIERSDIRDVSLGLSTLVD